MDWTKPVVLVVTFGVVVWAIGALVSLFMRFGANGRPTATAAVFGLLVASLGVAVVVGAKGPAWLSNPRHYW